jgi:hypothetical protein
MAATANRSPSFIANMAVRQIRNNGYPSAHAIPLHGADWIDVSMEFNNRIKSANFKYSNIKILDDCLLVQGIEETK